jgi:Ca2+-binding RTX toxin-like protein
LSEAHIRGVEVTAIELGNEWYNDYPSLLASGMSPVEYGRLASKMAEIVQAAIDEFTAENSLPSHWIEPKILVQLGRMPQETAQIFEQFNTSGERSAIDGTLTHRYDAGPYEKIENSPGKNFSEFSHWDELIAANNPADFGDMSRFVTEWNIGAKNAHLDGLLLASAQLELFTHLIKADIDHANFWAVQQNNKTNLSGSEGRTDLKISGELFDLLNDSVVGKQLLAAESGRDDIEFTAFSGDGTYVIFLSSRSDETTTFKLDLSDLVGDFTHIEGTFLGVGDGQDPLSHRSDPQVTEASHSDLVANGEIYIALEAYEIVRLTVSTGDAGAVFEGGYSVDSIFGTHGDDEIFGYGGHDWLAGGLGSDKIWGGAGHDRIFAHNGSDRAFGGAGNDLLQMGAGHDKAWGGAGHDTLKGFKGNDLLVGQGGTDKLYGGPGKDIFVFNATDIFGQEEIMDFQPDEDSIVLRGINPNDLSFAVIGQDQLELSFLDTNVQGTILLHGQISTSDLVMGENLIVV